MSQYSHSKIECFETCKFKYLKRYVEKVKVIPPTNADNALFCGTAIHTGVEKDVTTALQEYFNQFPVITDEQINEQIKFEYLIPRVKAIIPPDGAFELPLTHSDFIGFIDYTSPNADGTFDLWDFKYSNNIKNYIGSGQLHEYKYFFELQSKKRVRKLNYLFIPKVSIKQKKSEDLHHFRRRIKEELEKTEIKIISVDYDPNKVIEFYSKIKSITETTDFPKEPNYLCGWCEFENLCQKGEDYMILPKNERRIINSVSKKVIWLYGVPFCGKTTLANSFPDPLMLNTDGNIKFVDAPFISIKDQVTVEGRITKRKLAWEVFEESIDELEKKQNDFKTIIVDLLEDCFEHCRIYIYDRDKIEHESDNSFKYYDVVRTKFLSTLKRLMNLDYENIILISHEDTSKDVTKPKGDKITAIKPNLTEKVAVKVAGMVDIVARVVVDEDDVRTLNFKSTEVIFGGGRLKGIKTTKIPLSLDALINVYDEANSNVNVLREAQAGIKTRGKESPVKVENPVNQPETSQVNPAPEDGRRRRGVSQETKNETPSPDEVKADSQLIDKVEAKMNESAPTPETKPEADQLPFDGGQVITQPAAEPRKTRKKRGE